MFARFRSLFRALTKRRYFEAGMTEELRFHIEQYTEDPSAQELHRRKRSGARAWNSVGSTLSRKTVARRAASWFSTSLQGSSTTRPASYGATPVSPLP